MLLRNLWRCHHGHRCWATSQVINSNRIARALPRRFLATTGDKIEDIPFLMPSTEHDSDYDSDRESFLLDIPIVNSEQEFTAAVLDQVETRDGLNLSKNDANRLGAAKPVIWRGRMCDALALWAQPEYLAEKVPSNVVCEVEWGSYNKPSSERLSIDYPAYDQYLREAIRRFGQVKQNQVLYMAQNDLPKELYDDLGDMPSFLGSLTEDPLLKPAVTQEDLKTRRRLYNVNWWVGPAACRSPLHFDPLDNILMQFVGHKKIWLIRPTMFCYQGLDETNNQSLVDTEDKDIPEYPEFKTVPCRVATLCPGDVIYIPAKWWHATRVTNAAPWSASVNAWWR